MSKQGTRALGRRKEKKSLMESLGTLSLSCTVGGLPDSGPEAFSVLLQDCPNSQWPPSLAPVAAGSGPAETSRWCGEEDCGWTADVMPPSLDMGRHAGAE